MKDLIETVGGFLIGAAMVAAIIYGLVQSCYPGYKDPKINKVERGVRVNLYSDTTVFCGPDTPYFTAIRDDSSEVNCFTPCFRCGEVYSEHRTSTEWAMKVAAANN